VPHLRTAVVGAGISGLTLAWALRARGTQVTVLESSDRVGGQIRSWLDEGFVLEAGRTGILDRDGAVARSRRATGDSPLPLRLGRGRPSRALRPRQAPVPSSEAAPALGSDIVPWWAKLMLLLEPFSRRGPAGVDESLARFGRRHFGRHVTETLLDAVQTGIFGATRSG
jgi:oxygen-dependent protoporphyrinogen oxidase